VSGKQDVVPVRDILRSGYFRFALVGIAVIGIVGLIGAMK
jgi:hypothetical protein